MILVDTSVWIDHLRSGDAALETLLEERGVLGHPFVIGEIALGRLRDRDQVLHALLLLPSTTVASESEVLHLITSNALYGLDIGYVDAHLLAAVRLTPGARLWTRDRRLADVAHDLGLSPTQSLN